MLYFFDESGNFAAPSSQGDEFGVISSVIVPETVAPSLQHAYGNFVTSVSPSEKKNGEPKGKMLTDRSRKLFAELLRAFPDAMIHTTVLDLAASGCDLLEAFSQKMRQSIASAGSKCLHRSMRDDMDLLARQAGNLSVSQLSRLFCLGRAIFGAFQCSLERFIAPDFNPCFARLRFEIDRTHTSDENRFRDLIRLWIPVWSLHQPTGIISGVHEAGHPVIRNFGTTGGFDGKKTFSNNIEFVDSRTSWGIQIADILGNTVLRALRDPTNSRDSHDVLVRMAPNWFPRKDNLLGLFCMGKRYGRAPNGKHRRLLAGLRHAMQQGS